MANKRKRGRYYLDDATVLPEMIVTPKGNNYLTDELGNPAVSMGALRYIDPNLMVMINRQLNDNQYRTMPTNAEASAVADAYAEQTAPGADEALKIINSYPNTGPKSFIIPGLRKDVNSLPYVWKALVGTQFGALPFIINKNK